MLKQKNIKFETVDITAIERRAKQTGMSFSDFVRAAVNERMTRCDTQRALEEHKRELSDLHLAFKREIANTRLELLADSKSARAQTNDALEAIAQLMRGEVGKLESFREELNDQQRDMLKAYLKGVSAQIEKVFGVLVQPQQSPRPSGTTEWEKPTNVDPVTGSVTYK